MRTAGSVQVQQWAIVLLPGEESVRGASSGGVQCRWGMADGDVDMASGRWRGRPATGGLLGTDGGGVAP